MINFKTYIEFTNFLLENGFYLCNDMYPFKNYNKSDYIYISENVSGYSGGNCWGGEATHYENDYPSYEEFHKIVDLIFSKDEVEKRKEEIECYIMEDEHTESEYYGNSSRYVYYILDLENYYNSVLCIKEIRKQKLNEIKLDG